MTIALRLAQQGKNVTLIESAPVLGGLASAWSLGDVTWDRHYHVTLLSDSNLRAVLRELGLESDMEWVETKTGYYGGDELYPVSNTIEFLRLPALRLLDKLRLDVADGTSLQFDRVVVTAAAPIAAKLCAGLDERERAALEAVTYQGIVCVSLLLEQPLAPYYLTYITDRSCPFTAVIEMST